MHDLVSGATRCLLVQPSFSSHSFWNYRDVCRLVGAQYPAAPLGLMTVAALLPAHWHFRLVDENVRALTDADLAWADLVLVTGMLPQQRGILHAIERAHAAGKPVAVGGPDATSQPEVYASADYLVLGEGEIALPPFLQALQDGATRGTFVADGFADMTRSPVPRFDLIRFRDYLMVGIQFSRGCPFGCEFCDVIELFGQRPRTKTPEQLVAELQALYDLGYRGHVDLVDDNLIGNKRSLLPTLRTVRDWLAAHGYPFFFSTEASLNLAQEPELLSLMRDIDVRYVFLGIETPDEASLRAANKLQNTRVSITEAVATLAAHGMVANGGFILGFDGDDHTIAERMIALIEETGVTMAMVGMLSALPKTRLARRLASEGRLFDDRKVEEHSISRVDQTTTGLNFVTRQPRAQILAAQAQVLQRIYSPESYFRRARLTALRLHPSGRYRGSLRATAVLARALLRMTVALTRRRETAGPYWRALGAVLSRNPRALEAFGNLAAMYLHFARQSEYAVQAITQERARLAEAGEAAYNATMLDATTPRAWHA